MKQYIDKSSIVAEIEKLKAYLQIPNASTSTRPVQRQESMTTGKVSQQLLHHLLIVLTLIFAIVDGGTSQPSRKSEREMYVKILNLKQRNNDQRRLYAGNYYMCLKDIEDQDSFTKGKVYASFYDNALINDNHIEVKVKNGECFRIATENEIRTQKEK